MADDEILDKDEVEGHGHILKTPDTEEESKDDVEGHRVIEAMSDPRDPRPGVLPGNTDDQDDVEGHKLIV